MAVDLVAEKTIRVGKRTTIHGESPSTDFGVVFEDDGETAYFYGLDLSNEDQPIVDAMHIYNVKQVKDRAKPSLVQIVWSMDGLKAGLMINEYPHAIFDFEAKRGYCRTGFPPPDSSWTKFSHEWDDDAEKLFE